MFLDLLAFSVSEDAHRALVLSLYAVSFLLSLELPCSVLLPVLHHKSNSGGVFIAKHIHKHCFLSNFISCVTSFFFLTSGPSLVSSTSFLSVLYGQCLKVATIITLLERECSF